MPLYMLLEAVLPGVAGAATLAPVQGEILKLGQSKGARHAVETLQELEHVFARGEVPGQGLALT